MVRLIVGIALIGVAFIELFLFIGGPENKLVADVMTSTICQRGEHITEVKGGYVYNSDGSRGQSVNFYCQNEAGNKRDVTGSGVILGILGYVVPFLSGLALAILGPMGMARGRKKGAAAAASGMIGFSTGAASNSTDPFGKPINVADFHSGQPISASTIFTLNGEQVDMSSLSPEVAQRVQTALGRLGSMMESGNFVMQGGDLTHKLEQLKDARDKNLITEEEYEHLRQTILDHME